MGKLRRAWAAVAVVAFGLLAGPGMPWGASAQAATALPPVLPAVQQWQPASGGGFAWTGTSRVVVNTADQSALSDDARTFASDLELALHSGVVPVVDGALSAARPGDVFLGLGSTDTGLGDEGYGLTIAPVLQAGARSAKGVFWATQTILQLLHQQTTLPPGSVRDWPKYAIRAALVDDGARSFPLRWWFNQIRELSYLKVNEITFTVHRFGLTADEEQQILAYGAKYHVPVTPVRPMPSYMQVVTPYVAPEHRLTEKLPNGQTRLVPGALDLTNPQAVDWALNVTSSQLPTFAGPAWHIGADEYPDADRHLNQLASFPDLVNYAHQRYGPDGTPEDVFRNFVNRNDNLVRGAGKSMRMWGDDLFPSSEVGLNSDIVVEEWVAEPGRLEPAQLAANGNPLVNADQDFLYYDEGDPNALNTSPQRIWEQFDPGRFSGGDRLPGGDSDPHLAGIEMAQWDSMGEDPGQLERDLSPLDQALAQRAWGSPKLSATWSGMQSAIAAIGLPPGYLATPLGGIVTAATNTIRLPDGIVATYRVGSDGNVWGTNQLTPGGPFTAWARLSTGGGFTGTPSVIRAGDGTLGLYVRTTSGDVWGASQQQPAGPFVGWGPLSGSAGSAGDPTVIFTREGIAAVYFVGGDGYVWGASQSVSFGAFSPWTRLSPTGGYVGRPAVIRSRDRLISIYARTSSDTVVGSTQLSFQGPFGNWDQLGTTSLNAAGDPAVNVTPSGAVGLYVTGADGNVWGTSQTQAHGPFGAWDQLTSGGGYAGRPAVVQTTDGLISLYARTTGGGVGGATQQGVGGPFGTWSTVGSVNLSGDPTALLTPDDTTVLFGRGTDGNTWNTGQSQPHGPFGPWRRT